MIIEFWYLMEWDFFVERFFIYVAVLIIKVIFFGTNCEQWTELVDSVHTISYTEN